MLAERPTAPAGLVEPDLRLERLRETAALIGRMAGETPSPVAPDKWLETTAHAAVCFADLPPVLRRRYDAIASETATSARIGLALLVDLPASSGVAAAAAQLAGDLRAGVAKMAALLE